MYRMTFLFEENGAVQTRLMKSGFISYTRIASMLARQYRVYLIFEANPKGSPGARLL